MKNLTPVILLSNYRYSFDKRVRKDADNPTIVDMARVTCPPELVLMSQVKRTDDPGYPDEEVYEIMEENRPADYQNGGTAVEPCR